ncbi:Retrovirus-related Pol polyprotein [Arachis hypogaea]|nr:Retrovirus-related Pol polyprotein [Arachis hypogaea]
MPPRRSQRLTKPPTYLSDYLCNIFLTLQTSPSSMSRYPISSVFSFSSLSPSHRSYISSLHSEHEPKTFRKPMEFFIGV